jgi:hypothetical protein
MKLYEIAQEYQSFLDAVESGIIPEDAISDTLESITSVLEDKADNIASMLKNMAADIVAIKAEETALSERRKAKEKQYEDIESYLSRVLLESGMTKIETARNKITFRKSESVVVDNDDQFIAWAKDSGNTDMLTYKEPAINKTAIKKRLASGEEIEGVHIEKRQNIQIK